jgi:gamma-glutamylcyclotransferase (GGCT)/AIG2-like uncharacterized protein YtfP
MQNLLFVYGTLRKDYGNHGFLKNAHFVGEAKTQDKFVMHCRGYIPFVSESQAISQIVGEVYELDDSTLASIDHLEGCFPKRDGSGEFEASSWYIRKQIPIEFVGYEGHTRVWMYFNEQETQHPIICSGDYADRELLLNRQDRTWYFAYGSNMDVSRMLDRKAYFTQRKWGVVHGHRLVFNKISDDYPGYGFANIVPEHGFDAMGVLYEVNADGLAQLDRYEGVRGGHYFRTQMMVSRGDGTSVNAIVYLANPNKVKDGLLPTDSYMDRLYKGIDILGEGGRVYLDQALREARVTDEEYFLTAQDIPTPSDEDYSVDVLNHALPVLLNGHKAKMYFYTGTWSERLVFHCEPEVVPYFESMDLCADELGFFGTKYFNFIRRGILEIGCQRFVVERCMIS